MAKSTIACEAPREYSLFLVNTNCVIDAASNINDRNVFDGNDMSFTGLLDKYNNSARSRFAVERNFVAGCKVLAFGIVT